MLDLNKFIEMIIGGSQTLSLESDYINDLNIFPVPDGDTGSNMDTTVKGAILAINNKPTNNFKELADAFSKGLLMNARGNSGVIFSQIMRGFLSNFTENIKELNVDLLKNSFNLAKEKAYSSVVNPVEGTILTIIRCISEEVSNKKYNNVKELFADVIIIGEKTLEMTPKLLKELEEVGVVDSGGYGLLTFLKGMNAVLNNNLNELITKIKADLVVKKGNTAYIDESNFEFFDQHKNEDGFGYCSEIILNLSLKVDPNNKIIKEEFDLDKLKSELMAIGNSLVCVQFDNLVKIHIHTMKPHLFLQTTQKYGEFEKIKIENMTLQYEAKTNESSRLSNIDKIDNSPINITEGIGVVATAPTKKIAEFIKNDYGVDEVIITEEASGAPSLQVFLSAINKVAKSKCLIITDDSNIVMAANGAKEFSKTIKCEVIPAKNIFETIICASNIDKDESLKSNVKELTKILNKTLSAVISTSIKDVNYSHIDVKQNNKIGIINKKIVVSIQDEFAALKLTLDKLIVNKKGLDICFLIYGANANLSIIKKFEKYVSEQYGLYCEIISGNQKVYDYYIGLQ